MKRLPYVIAVVVILLSCLWYSASAATILFPSGGGTGSSTLTGLIKGNGLGSVLTAVSGTDYAPATSGSSLLYGNGAGGFSNATVGTGLLFTGGTLSATGGGGGSGTVGTSSSETAGYFPIWTTTNGTPALLAGNSSIFQNSGNIGIGTTSPTSLLNLSASDSGTTITAASAAMLDITNSNSTNNNFGDLAFSQKDASGNTVVTSKVAGIQTSHTAAATSGVLAFLTRNAGTFAEKMRITSAGLVGIGTTSPNSALSIQTAGAGVTLERVLTLANNATGGLWTIYDGAGTSFAAGYLNICQGECSGTNYELQFQGFGVAQARGAFSAPAFDSSITGRGASPILAWTNDGGNFNGTLNVGENYVAGNINLNNWIGGTGSWNIKRSDGTALALATLLNSNNNFGIGTSTPGTFISAGSSTNAINLDVYATSTLTHGLNITTGCFSVAGVCITGGGTSYTATYPVTLTGSAFGLAFGTTTSNLWAGTQTFTNSPVISTLGAGAVNSTSGGALYNTATSTPTLGLGLSYSGTLGQLIGGASGALSIATSSLYTGTTGQVPYFTGTNALIGTSTLTVSSASYVGVATSSPFAPLSVAGDFQQYGNYAHFGSAVPLFKSPAQSALELWGDDNTTNGVQVTIGNRNAGTSAYSGLNILNDRANSNVTNFAGLYLNSSTYSDTSFGTAEAFSNLLMLQNTLGATSFINSTTSVSSAYFNWIAGGSATSNEIARLTGAGNFGLGTTSPYAKFSLGGGNLVIGAATAGGTLGDLYLPKLGTSAGTFLAVDATGKVISTTTPTSSITGTTGQLPYFSASNTLSATSTLNISTASLVGIGSSTPSALATIGYGYQPSAFTIASTSVWAAGSYQYTAPTGTGYVQISLSGGGGSGDTGGGGQGAFVASSTIFMKGGDTGTIYVAQGGKFSGAQATGYKTGGLGASNVRNGGASSAFTASSTNQSLIACGGGGSGDTNGGSNATANSGGAGGAGGGSFAGGGGGCGTNGGNASGGTPGVGGTGGTYLSSLAGNGGSSGGNNGGDGKITVIAYAVPAGTTGIQLIAGLLTVNPSAVTIGTTTPQGTFTVQGVTGGTAEAVYSDSAPSQILNTLISSITYAVQIIDQYGHLKTGGPTPTVGTCAGFSIVGDDRTGVINMTSGTTCSFSFANSYANQPACSVGPETTQSTVKVTTTTTGVSVAFGTAQTQFSYICQYHQ